MKKLLLAPFFLFALVGNLLAQQNTVWISGKVTSSDGYPAAGLVISIKGAKTIAYTQNDGSFKIASPVGKTELLVKSSVASEAKVVAVNADQDLTIPTIQLAEKSHELKDVVVTGEYRPQSLKNSVQKVRTISNERITLRGATSVLEALSTELGVRFVNDLTLGETEIQIMGMGSQNVKVLIDGVPVVDRGSTKQSLSQLDINTVDRIEVVEGPMSVIYGTDALAGVINIITKRGNGQENLSVAAKIQEETVGKEYNGFSQDGTHLQNLAINYVKKGWEFGVGGTRNNSGGWQGTALGRRKQWRPKDQNLLNGRLGYRTNNLYVWYRLDFLDEDIIALGDINPANNKSTDAVYMTTRFTHLAQAEWRINQKLSLNAAASYQDYKRETLTTDFDFTTGRETLNLNTVGGQDLSGFKSSFVRSTLQYQLGKNIVLQPGFDVKIDASTGQRIHNGAEINDYSAFATSEITFNTGGWVKQIILKPGIRLTKNSVYDAPPVIPSLNAKIDLVKDIAVRLGYARGFRAPALRELYFTFHDASHDIEGSANLKAEYSNSFTGSVSWQTVNSSSFQFNSIVSGFYNDFNNLISTATGVDPQNPQWSYYVNIAKYKTTGGTFENQFNSKNVQVGVGLSLIGRFNSYSELDNSLTTFLWTPEVNANAIYKINKIGLNASLSYKYSGKRPGYELASGVVRETELSSMHWADLGLNKKVNSYLTVNGGIKNLFNVTTINNTSQDIGGAHSTGGAVPMGYGRSFFVGLTMQWNKN